MTRPYHRLGNYMRFLRESYGRTQQEVISDSPVYTEESSYRRVEAGMRKPKRNELILLLVLGIKVQFAYEVNRALRLGGYAILSPEEEAKLGLSNPS